ncbi:MAG: hypothetical protein Q8Q12_20805 [bacterium]|nr:hypothetical protein [bacterium]
MLAALHLLRAALLGITVASGVIAAERASAPSVAPLDRRGRIHIPIGIANSLDTLKTFVEAEGNFSPGFGSYGIYFWVFDKAGERLFAPTIEGVACEHGLAEGGLLIPWSRWLAEDITVRTEVCHVVRESPAGRVHVVGARAFLTNTSDQRRQVLLYVALRPLGPAGWNVKELSVTPEADGLLVDGHPALVAEERPTAAGVLGTDAIRDFALRGEMPEGKSATSEKGDCSGALCSDLVLSPGETSSVGVICPVLAGRRAARHKWVDLGQNALADVAELNPKGGEEFAGGTPALLGGILQPDPGLDYYRKIRTSDLFDEAEEHWRKMVERVRVQLPDRRWSESLAAILSHASLCMNEGAPDVAVVNYNVFNRDGVYVANMMQKAGVFDLAEKALDYFLSHPFNGRAYPEADNPGQILWCLGEHWLFTRDEEWLRRVYPSARKIAAMIQYYRTTEGPHWVSSTSLDFGPSLAEDRRQQLRPGRCDGYHPEYTEAFDIAGLRGAAILVEALGKTDEAAEWRALADRLLRSYDERFGSRLPKDYGSFSVLWPCRLYPLMEGKAREQFESIGGRGPNGWRYFPLATAHQGLLAGNREAGYATIGKHLEHVQMRGWYAFDEGGGSSSGGWHRVRTTWTRSVEKPGDNLSVAMPHGWAIAEFWLLMRDCLVFENEARLVLLAGIPEAWFTDKEGMAVENLPTHFGKLTMRWTSGENVAVLTIGPDIKPPGGLVLSLPDSLNATVSIEGKPIEGRSKGEFLVPVGTEEVLVRFAD